jgi:spermidine synthase
VVAYRQERGGDIIFGGNVYDGRTNLDPRVNSNLINRVLVLAALRPNPKRVLEIGLSIGTWNYLITGFPGIETIDVVEINPGYIELMKNYPAQQRALADGRIKLTIGDGRKVLRSREEAPYDLVVMNTTWHWRAYTSLLLSREFLTLVRSRMAPGALLAYNATESPDALYTAAAVFPHAYLYENFVVCADFDWRIRLDGDGGIAELLRIRPEGKPLFSAADEPLMRSFLSRDRTRTVEQASAEAGRPLEIITDRNLIAEYKYGRPLLDLWGW